MKINFFIKFCFLILLASIIIGQNNSNGLVSGNIQAIGQYYQEDTIINAALPEHLYGFNGFANVNYQKGDFRAGIRYESYLNTLEGYPSTFSGTGLVIDIFPGTMIILELQLGIFMTSLGVE